MFFDAQLPPDPFANDPDDPASFFDDDTPPPLSSEDIVALERDLGLVREFKRLLGPRGIRGIFFFCEDCEENHYFDWDIIAANMRATLDERHPPVHEPSMEPEVHAYVPWDYALGYYDAMKYQNPFH